MSLLDTASLIVTPNAYKEGKLYSVIPSDGSGDLSVTRATTATRVNSSGLVELVPYNLLTYSEQFNNADWLKYQSSVTANTTTAPDGTLTADSITDNSANDVHITYQIVNVNAGVNTISVYAKANTLSNINLQWYDGVSAFYVSNAFNLSTGTTTGANQSIENVGNGWYRCSYTITTTQTGTQYVYVMTNNGSSNVYVGTGQSLFIWGYQLVEGSSALPYQKTETRLNIPRLDYSNGTCPSILVEPQRTNLLTYSSSFDNAAWLKLNATISANTIASPSGIQDADSIIENTATGIHVAYQGPIAASSGIHTTSMFFKKNTRQYAFLQIAVNGAADRFTAVINLNNGNVTDTTTVGSPTSTSYTTEDFGNGWYRLTVSAQHNSGNVFLVSGLSDSATPTYNVTGEPNYTGNGTGSVYAWGAQLEAGSYATSYIPTTSASVTRNADAIYKTGISSLIGQTEGVAFIDFVWNGLTGTGSYPRILELWADSSNYIQLFNVAGTSTIYWDVYNGGSVQFSGNATMDLGHNKIAIAYKLNDIVIYKNGSLIASDTTCTIPTTSALGLTGTYNGVGGAQLAASINAAALWKTRLTNDELERLTGVGFNTYTEMANYYNYITQ